MFITVSERAFEQTWLRITWCIGTIYASGPRPLNSLCPLQVVEKSMGQSTLMSLELILFTLAKDLAQSLEGLLPPSKRSQEPFQINDKEPLKLWLRKSKHIFEFCFLELFPLCCFYELLSRIIKLWAFFSRLFSFEPSNISFRFSPRNRMLLNIGTQIPQAWICIYDKGNRNR